MPNFTFHLIAACLFVSGVAGGWVADGSTDQSAAAEPERAEGWVDSDGKRIPNSNDIKSVSGFGGSLVVTPDADWAEKWETPHDTVPYFSTADVVQLGERLTILTFFINPKVDPSGNVQIVCDVLVIRPDGTHSVDERIACVSGELKGDVRSVRLSPAILQFTGEPDDPIGRWTVEVKLIDLVRGVEVPLDTSFELVE